MHVLLEREVNKDTMFLHLGLKGAVEETDSRSRLKHDAVLHRPNLLKYTVSSIMHLF